MRKLIHLIVFLSVGIACQASTLVFDFSFVGTTNVPGTVTGEIDGLVDNTSNQAAIDIKILSYPTDLSGFQTSPFDVTSIATVVSASSFTVTNGAITSADFFASSPTGSLFLFLNDGGKNDLENDVTDTWTLNRDGFAGATYTLASASPVATPEPISMALAGTGVVALIALRLKRKRG